MNGPATIMWATTQARVEGLNTTMPMVLGIKGLQRHCQLSYLFTGKLFLIR